MLGGEDASVLEYKMKHQNKDSPPPCLTAYQRAEDVPMEEARALLYAHVHWAHGKFLALGAPAFDTERHVERFFGHLDQVLPPRGAYFLAHDAASRVVGTGALRRISETEAEMKHLYVRPEARESGLGARLVSARIDAARGLGLRSLVADTFRGNGPMIRLYRRLGFVDAEPYDSAVATLTPELIPHLQYFRMDL